MLAILFVTALAGTIFPLTLFPEGYVVLGSCSVLLLVRLYGTRWGLLAAMLAGSCAFVAWQHPFFALIMLAEALVVGMLLRRGMQNILVADGIFWLLLGLPFLWIFFAVLIKSGDDIVLQMLIRYGFNGLGNALLATIGIHFLASRGSSHKPPLLQEAQFNLLISAFLLPAALVVLLNAFSMRDAIVPAQASAMADLVEPVYNKIIQLEHSVQNGLKETARLAAKGRLRGTEDLRQTMEGVRRSLPVLQQIFVVDAQGRVLASSGKNAGTMPKIEPEDLEALATHLRPILVMVSDKRGDASQPICWYQPVVSGEKFNGVVGGLLDREKFAELLTAESVPEEIPLTLIDHQGSIIASTRSSSDQEENFYRTSYSPEFFFDFRRFLWQPANRSLASIPAWSGISPPEPPLDAPLPWQLAVEIPRHRYLAHLQTVVGGTLAVMLFPALLALGMVPLISKRLTRPLKRLAEITADLPERIRRKEEVAWPIGGSAEIGAVTNHLQALAATLEESYRQIESLKEVSEETLDRVLSQQRWEAFSASRKLQQEIGKRRRIEELLEHIEAAETKYRFLVEQTLVGVFIVQDDYFSYVNPRFAEIFGYTPEEIIRGGNVLSLIGQEDRAFVAGNFRRQLSGEVNSLQYEFRGRRKDGSQVYVEALNNIGSYNGRNAILGTLIDISERKKAEQTIRHLAYHDPLTGLPNRLLFNDRADQAIAMARRDKEVLALLFIDLDRFKAVNDTLGHNVGDRLLKEVAARLSECVRESDTVSRFGGDEFNMLLTQVRNESDTELIAHKVLRTLRWPFYIDGHELHGSASVGIAIFPRDGHDVQTLIKNADTALYRAKDLGRNNYQIFNAAMNAQALERMEMENSLRRVLERRELRVYYQAQACLKTGRIIGMEALLRWQHPSGMISPAAFIPLAEELGLIFPIGEWMMRTACRQAMAWQREDLPPLRLGINVSAQQFQDREFMAVLEQILAEFNFDPEWLNVEITESVVMQDVRENILKLRQLHTIGVTVAIDDFGVGYSSLSYLKDFPVDQLKMDRSFVQNLPESGNDAKIAQHIVEMAHSLGLSVIAEGVEKREQLDFLRSIGCDEIQGYLLSRPLPAEEFEKLLASNTPFPSFAVPIVPEANKNLSGAYDSAVSGMEPPRSPLPGDRI